MANNQCQQRIRRAACLLAGAALAGLTDAAPAANRVTFPQDPSVIDLRRDFGAKGDGVADDTAALQAAIEASSDRGHGGGTKILFLPNGTIDIKGAGKSVSVVVWAIRESGNHALAGIWHEGTDLNHAGAAKVVARGQRQYALFAGLNKEGSACGHVSENGANSFGHIYAMHKSNSGDISPAVPADAPAGVLDASWQCFATTFDHERHELTGWLNGRDTGRWQENVQKAIPVIHNAWVQGHLHLQPGRQPGEDPNFPNDQFYNPPEDKPVFVKVRTETHDERVELQEFRYTRVKVTQRKAADGTWTTVARDLADVRLNPWWYPHDSIYTPANDGTGGPFTIGRVIHSSRSVGFTGWIGGVAVFNRALSAKELSTLSDLSTQTPIAKAK